MLLFFCSCKNSPSKIFFFTFIIICCVLLFLRNLPRCVLLLPDDLGTLSSPYNYTTRFRIGYILRCIQTALSYCCSAFHIRIHTPSPTYCCVPLLRLLKHRHCQQKRSGASLNLACGGGTVVLSESPHSTA